METPRELPVVAGHLALDFANTVDDPLGPRRHDHVATYPDLVAWSVRLGTLTPAAAGGLLAAAADAPRRAAAVVRRAAALRDALNDTFGALADGGDPAPHWPRLRPYAAASVSHAEVAGRAARWPADDLEMPLWPVADAAYRLLTDPGRAPLKRCGGCPWLFLDRSRNGSRRWCAMDDCGKHEKIQRYVAKRAAARSRHPA